MSVSRNSMGMQVARRLHHRLQCLDSSRMTRAEMERNIREERSWDRV